MTVLSLSLKTLKCVVIVGALLMMLSLFLIPGFAQSFYSDLGNQKMAYKFLAREVDAGGEDTEKVIEVVDLAISLSKDDQSYLGDVEKYVTKLLSREDSEEAFARVDAYNLSKLPARMHPNFYSIKDYYVTTLYSVRLANGNSDLYVDGDYVSVADYLKGEYGSSDADVTALNQLAIYIAGGGEGIDANHLKTVFDRAQNVVLTGFRVEFPTLKQLFAIKSLSYLAYYAEDINANLGKIVQPDLYGGCESLSQLYTLGLNNYNENYNKD